MCCGAAWKWENAAEMVALSKELDFAFMAGSSLPTAWRMPPIDMPYGTRPPVRLFTFARPSRQPTASTAETLTAPSAGAEVEEALTVSIGSVDSYDFHALDALQCMVERRLGGETGILSVQAARGDQVCP